MNQAAETIRQRLFALQDTAYQAFHAKLMPTVDPSVIIGVRIPLLRKLAKELASTPEAAAFMAELPHRYYEENTLHGLLICRMNDYAMTVQALDRFLPFVDNWATCDCISPQAFRRHPDELPGQLHHWLTAAHPYTVRFGIGMLMQFYLDADFQPIYLDWVAEVHSEEYYVNMMIAWYFATALAKQPQITLPVLQQNRLSTWVHNKTIQKAVESYRIPPEQKAYLRTLRRKEPARS
ncbi:DNA alkylation repair protein [uncultured Gemmiger sp.]|uniref:DNA alkylation repair protein n=1 Tax=uncultured Gemmiger sp. TaxID=1623490 RepID=UPI0025F78952|nr:DNA alkylation repair protein [uncultured Gemmiger sp.]